MAKNCFWPIFNRSKIPFLQKCGCFSIIAMLGIPGVEWKKTGGLGPVWLWDSNPGTLKVPPRLIEKRWVGKNHGICGSVWEGIPPPKKNGGVEVWMDDGWMMDATFFSPTKRCNMNKDLWKSLRCFPGTSNPEPPQKKDQSYHHHATKQNNPGMQNFRGAIIEVWKGVLVLPSPPRIITFLVGNANLSLHLPLASCVGVDPKYIDIYPKVTYFTCMQ